jgi:hypothetical protein
MILVAGASPPVRRHAAGHTAVIIALRSAPGRATRWTAAPARVPPRPTRAATITDPE